MSIIAAPRLSLPSGDGSSGRAAARARPGWRTAGSAIMSAEIARSDAAFDARRRSAGRLGPHHARTGARKITGSTGAPLRA